MKLAQYFKDSELHRLTREAYVRAYEKGWRKSQRPEPYGMDSNPYWGHFGEAEAWDDGYLDFAVDRPKWATPLMGYETAVQAFEGGRDGMPEYRAARRG